MDTVNRFVFPALREHAARPLQVLRDRTWTYNDAARAVHGIAQHLRERGLRPGDRVALLGENAPEWLHAFLGVLAAGGVAVPRGEDTPPEELRWVLEHSGAALAFVGSPKIAPLIPAGIEQIPLTGLPEPADVSGDELAAYASAAQPEDLAVLLYTSGTTGRPKGVMLEQRNIAHNLRTVPALVPIEAGDVWVSILPPWHTFELTVELCALSIGCMTAYSNKRRIKQDLAEHRPHFFAGVPRLWEAFQTGARDAIRKRGPFLSGLFEKCFASSRLWRKRNPLGLPLHALGKLLFYRKVARAIGGRLKYGICGGGYLPPHVDEFFAIMGVEILVGYGLT
ncbi:MAG: AMP-binding protein, partial [Planctomycetota bacterium]